jgi:hypothetical protein
MMQSQRCVVGDTKKEGRQLVVVGGDPTLEQAVLAAEAAEFVLGVGSRAFQVGLERAVGLLKGKRLLLQVLHLLLHPLELTL